MGGQNAPCVFAKGGLGWFKYVNSTYLPDI